MPHTTPDTPRRSPTSRAVWRWATLAIALLAWAYALFGSEGILHQRQRRANLDTLKAQLAQEKAINERLAAEIDGLKHDDLVKEQAIREVLDYQRPDELVIIVEPEDPLSARTAQH